MHEEQIQDSSGSWLHIRHISGLGSGRAILSEKREGQPDFRFSIFRICAAENTHMCWNRYFEVEQRILGNAKEGRCPPPFILCRITIIPGVGMENIPVHNAPGDFFILHADALDMVQFVIAR